jgi:lipopolysaccharide biosynthesis protein
MEEPPLFSVFIHSYYEVETLLNRLIPLSEKFSFDIFLNTVLTTGEKEDKHFGMVNLFPSGRIVHRRSTNAGKDIGGKLVLIDTFIRLESTSEFVVFLHDKKSPHKVGGDRWFENLISIVEPTVVDKVLDVFRKDQRVGIIAAKGSLAKDQNDNGQRKNTNAALLEKLKDKYHIHPHDATYVAGTMFWARTEIIMDFFRNHNPLEIRESLEEGNVLDNTEGTMTHSWERLLSWIVSSQGYSIEEV